MKTNEMSDQELFDEWWDENEAHKHYAKVHTASASNVFLAACELKNKIIAEKDARIKELEKDLNRFKDALFPMSVKIVKRDKLIEQAKPYIEYLKNGKLYSNHIVEQWLKDYEELEI